ncbi:MAG: molybdopterin-guanine dinucleotide biosynthesis protein [Pseudomonadota bacterium]
MGGVDKGLVAYRGRTLAEHALQRLAPQVGPLMISANRHLDTYRGFGVPVLADAQDDYPGPMAGFLAGLQHCTTPYLITVPCDTPHFPETLVARMTEALQRTGADIVLAADGPPDALQRQPVFCLLHVSLLDSLRDFVLSGQGKIGLWAEGHRCTLVHFSEPGVFANANTADELHRLQ